jgi:HAD superfamily hydrolase (TIGR01662 family)
LFSYGAAIALHVMPDSTLNPAAVLFDRDGTLVADVPYNGDATAVVPMPTVQLALAALRRCGVRTGVVTNQSGIGRGALSWRQVARVNERVEELLGPFDVWRVCPHTPADRCACRKPAPGMVRSAATALRLPPSRIAVVGDIGADVAAALAAGARAVLVPTPATHPEEVMVAPDVAPTLLAAVELLLETDRLEYAS